MSRIVNTDNFGGDYPDEKFVENLPRFCAEKMQKIADAINKELHPDSPRYFKVVSDDYVLQPGFEP